MPPDDRFPVIAPTSPDTIQSIITECKNYENLQGGRIFQLQFERLPEVTQHLFSCNDLASFVRDIVLNYSYEI